MTTSRRNVFNTVWDYQTMIKDQLIDYVRSAVTHAGGISPMRKVMDYAAQYQITEPAASACSPECWA
jgi:L-alanine-DL-glutamate epimerase-like enolase superfamily enzyme